MSGYCRYRLFPFLGHIWEDILVDKFGVGYANKDMLVKVRRCVVCGEREER